MLLPQRRGSVGEGGEVYKLEEDTVEYMDESEEEGISVGGEVEAKSSQGDIENTPEKGRDRGTKVEVVAAM